ncbi:hypothetical protein AFLA_010131 [Aspergillus flavus NRRL3357]|nr:hypothetical protein AFLA_010131 [Aspergillus flavus NRRL3357]
MVCGFMKYLETRRSKDGQRNQGPVAYLTCRSRNSLVHSEGHQRYPEMSDPYQVTISYIYSFIILLFASWLRWWTSMKPRFGAQGTSEAPVFV